MFASFIIAFVCIVPALLFLLHYKMKQRQKIIYPLQKKLIRELIDDLNEKQIEIIFSREEPKGSSVTITLTEAKDLLDTKKELAKEKYDELNLYFTNNFNQVLDFEKYFKEKILPKEIISELQHFQNTSYTKADPEGEHFVIITSLNQEKNKMEHIGEGLFTGNAEAFESWLSFKESADNLNYVINQWLRENNDEKETEMHWEFGRTETNKISV